VIHLSTIKLRKILTILKGHHSRDLNFLATIAAAMADTAPWRCAGCRQLRKHAATYCQTCQQPWQNVIDRTYVHQPGGRQGHQTAGWNYDQSNWDPTQQWNRARQPSRSQTPKSRRRSNSAKTPKGQHKGQGKGRGGGMGKGKGVAAPLPPPQIPWPGYAMHGMPVPPMPTLPPPQMMPVNNPGTSPAGFSWPAMPPPPDLPATISTTSPVQTSEEKELVEMIKTRQMELPPDMRMKVQNFAKKEGARATKDLHTAVRLQGRARQDLEDALQARFNLIASWKTFLTDAIRTWQEYATLFQQQEKDVQTKIQEAQDQFNQANVQLDQSQTAAGKVKTIVIKDEDDEIAEGQATISSASDKIHDSFKTLSTSLLQLQAQTEQIETDMQAAKRPRLSMPSAGDQLMEPTEEGQAPQKGPPFTQAG